MRLRDVLPQVILIGFSIVLVFTVRSDMPTFIRSIMTVIFLLFCPGIAFVWLLNIQDRLANFLFAIALSLALGVIVTEAIVLTNDWSSDRALFILVGLTCLGALLQILIISYNFSKQAEV